MPDGKRVLTAVPRGAVLTLGGLFVLMAVMLFLPAGDIRWAQGWLFLLAYVVLMIPSVIYLGRTNPDIFVARGKIHRGTKNWDKVLLSLLLFLMAVTFPLAALDAGRFHWSSMPLWLTVVGDVLFALGVAGSVWAMSVNRFAEPSVRIQTDRGHEVVDTGPYAIVRHPYYVASFVMAVGIPLALGSFWALIPQAIGAVVIIVRTALEDRMLQDELAGYPDYASRVRYRLIPGVW
jgi:protein-S-isoprenylcysteine O-methyltransferase Ste14